MSKRTQQSTYAGVCLALCLLLPLITGNIPSFGSAFLPMHLPVFLCGFLCDWGFGLLIGFVAPILRFLIFGMPPLFPTGIAMAFELAVYGFVSGILFRVFPKRIPYIYLTLGIAMLSGRAVWGIVQTLISGLSGSAFTWKMFTLAAFINAVPGIILQIIVVPIAVFLLQKKQLTIHEQH